MKFNALHKYLPFLYIVLQSEIDIDYIGTFDISYTICLTYYGGKYFYYCDTVDNYTKC